MIFGKNLMNLANLNTFRAMVAMLSRKSGLFYTDFGYDYSCLVIRNGVIIFATKQDYPNYKGKLLYPSLSSNSPKNISF